MMYEVFDPKNGIPLYTTKYKVYASFLADWLGLDYAEVGQGW